MNRSLFIACCSLLAWSAAFAADDAASAQKYLLGKWTQEMIGARTGGAIINITAVDPKTGQITGKYYPPSGPAKGQEFNVTGWISSAPPQPNADNVITIAFAVSLATYGSISSETGYFKDGKIYGMWFNVRPNTTYDWAHIATGEDIWTKTPDATLPSPPARNP